MSGVAPFWVPVFWRQTRESWTRPSEKCRRRCPNGLVVVLVPPILMVVSILKDVASRIIVSRRQARQVVSRRRHDIVGAVNASHLAETAVRGRVVVVVQGYRCRRTVVVCSSSTAAQSRPALAAPAEPAPSSDCARESGDPVNLDAGSR